MKQNSYDLLNKINFSKVDFARNSNKFNFITKSLYFLILIIILIILYLFLYINYQFQKQNNNIHKSISLLKNNQNNNENSLHFSKTKNFETEINLDKYETNIYNNIKNKIIGFSCNTEMSNIHREFLNGVVRRFRPKKILEIGVYKGCSSSVILNAIQDLDDSHLYSIDLSSKNYIGKCVRTLFKDLLPKWTLYTGDIASKFMEKIGKNIDMVLIDSAHFEPGEILDFIIVLPFLSDEAIVVIHDIANQITVPMFSKNGWMSERNEWAPYIIFNSIRGKTYLPSGKNTLTQGIGAKKLDIDQKKYYKDYFRLLGGQWQYFPKEEYIKEINDFFLKHYDNECMNIFNDTVNFNRKFVKENPKNNLYDYN